MIARHRALGELGQGDWLVIDATGANTLSLWSRHCSRVAPKVLTYGGDHLEDGLRLGKDRESIDDVLAFWGYG